MRIITRLTAGLLTVALFMLAVAVPTAHAAPPTLTSSPASPVCFNPAMIQQNTPVQLQILWTDVLKAQLIARDLTTQTKLVDKTVTTTNNQPLLVVFGHTYSVQLLDVATGRDVAPPLSIMTKQ